MANVRLIKGRIRSSKNIAQITKAMELVAASKMRKAQMAAQAGRLYASRIFEMVMRLAAKVDYVHHPLLTKPKEPTGKRLVILISTNKGMCGGLNANLFRFASHEYRGDILSEYVTVGRKGADFVVRIGKTILADFSETSPFIKTVPAITQMVTEKFVGGQYDAVDVLYNDFISAITQTPKKKTILPITLEHVDAEKQEETLQYTIEPDAKTVFDSLLPHYLENQIRDAILEAEASEHSARMIAMRNATDNALSLIDELTLLYNKARQEKITYEITDMITARLAAE